MCLLLRVLAWVNQVPNLPHALPAFSSRLFSRGPWPDSVPEAKSLGFRSGAEGAHWPTRLHTLQRLMRSEGKRGSFWPQCIVQFTCHDVVSAFTKVCVKRWWTEDESERAPEGGRQCPCQRRWTPLTDTVCRCAPCEP